MPKRIQVPLDDDLVEEFEALADQEARPLGNLGMILIREAMAARKDYRGLSKSQLETIATQLNDEDLLAMLGTFCEEFVSRRR